MNAATRPFEDLVRDRTGADFVRRDWLHERVERALADGDSRYVLVTGEPGAGKTSLLAGLADAHPDWLRYFVRRDSRTALAGGDVASFLLSVGHQLASQRPEVFARDRLEIVVRQHVDAVEAGGSAVGIRIGDLTASPFHRTATLALEQRVTGRVSGSVSGIEIGTANLEPRLLEPDNLAHLALIGPAEVLAAEDPDARIVVLVDALDELAVERASLLDWLARGPELPSNVRFVLSSRPHAVLGPLRSARAGRLHEIAIDPTSRQVVEDLVGYAERALGTPAVTRAAVAAGRDPEQVRRDAVGKAAGNFLYLATYARALDDAVAAGDDHELVTALLASADLPPGLGGLYAFFVATLHADLARLGMLEVRDPTGAADTLTPAWEGVGQPILGLLTVAREPLTVEELTALAGIRVWPRAVRNVLARLRWLLDERDGRVAFYHASIGEFLAGTRHPDHAVDTSEWHERIVRHYRGTATSWAEVDWSAVDRYGLVQLAEHAVRCRDAVADDAVGLVSGGLRRAVRTRLGSDRHFLRLLDLVTDRVVPRLPVATGVPTTLYLGVVRRQVLRGGRTLAPAVLGLMARLGRTEEALEHLAALPPSREQFEAAAAMAEHRPELLELVVETALTVPPHEARDGGMTGESRHPVKRAARLLAPHDLSRALRLWERADSRPEEPDPLYRAAASAADPARARELIPSIRADRAGAWLDLAARAEPADVPELLRLAEESLPDAPIADRLRARARLAVVSGERHLPALRAEADHCAEDPNELIKGVIGAAAELVGHDDATARALLDRVDAAELNGRVEDAFLRAAALWVELGDRGRAVAVLDRVLAWSTTVWTLVRVGGVVARFDPNQARRMVDRAYAMIDPPAAGDGGISRIFRESHLDTVAVELAGYDPGRAVAVAGELAGVGWSEAGHDRYTTLARVAHRRLDVGDTGTARSILDDVLRSAELAPPLVDGPRLGPYFPVDGRGDRPRSARDGFEHLPYLMNHTRDWQFLSERRFHRDPADVIRAMTPGSWSTGNPYGLARTVRVFAEVVGERDLSHAAALVNALTDGGERAVAVASLFRSAVHAGLDEAAEHLWDSFNESLAFIPRYEWAVEDQDPYAFAYVRPDHRARFEAALRLIPYEADPGMALLASSGVGFLRYAFRLSFGAFASAAYVDSVLHGVEPFPVFRDMHERALTVTPPAGEDPLLDVARAAVAFHEFRRSPERHRAGAIRIEHPVYAAVVDLVAATDGPAGAAFTERVRGLLPGERLPAAAGLVALAAELWPGHERVERLAAEVVAATEGRGAQRVVALLPFAASPALGHLVDPVGLLAEARRLPDDPFTRVEQDEVLLNLFPVLLRQHPAVALRLLAETVPENWERAMALLEHAARPLVAAFGPEVADRLVDAVRRGLACASPDDTAPAEVDGVLIGS
ncbi:AAA family ATPase [Saccharothrix saharensis]|uniref:AAA family ATPase n=1 Tax=Saccharothrix saharensis TaxID=571190 RepID=UPI0036B0846E